MYENLISTLDRYQIGYTLYLGCTCSLLTGVAHPLAATWSSRVLEMIVNEDQREGPDDEINRLCVSFILLGITVMVLSSCGRASWLLVSESWAQRVRLLFLEHTLSSPSHCSNSGTAGIELINSIAGIGTAGSLCLSSLLHTASSCVTSIVVCFIHNAKLTLVILSMMPLMVLMTIGFERVARSYERRRWTSFLYLNSLTLHAVGHATTLRQLAIHGNYLTYYKQAQEAFVKSHYRWCHFPAARAGVVELLSCGIFIVGFWYGALLVAGPESLVATQDVVVVLYNCLFLLLSLQRVQSTMTWFESNSTQLTQLDQLCSSACQPAHSQHSSVGTSILTPKPSESREQSDKHIELQNVSFGYGQQPTVIRNLNLVIPRGKIILIHGSVGSGKSTLLKLMNGELSPLQGKLQMDGVDAAYIMDQTPLETSRLSSRGVVDFDPLFFEETVFRNISFGRHDFWNVTLNQVIHACRLVGLHDTINQWPLKYATVLSRNALSLSSSQRKQMAIARAFIQDPDILFMDEPTSSVDESLNTMLFKAIGSVRAGKTTVIISHRLDGVVNIADEVINMELLMDPFIDTLSTRNSTDTKEEATAHVLLQNDNVPYERPLIKRRSIRQSILLMMETMRLKAALPDDFDSNMDRYQRYVCDNMDVYYYHHKNHRLANIVAAPSDTAIALPSPVATKSRRIPSTRAANDMQDGTTATPRFDSLPSHSCHHEPDPRSSLQITGTGANQLFWWVRYAWIHRRLYKSVLALYVLCLGQGILVPFYSSALSKLLASYSQLLDHNTVTFRHSLVPVIGFSAAKALLSWFTQWYQHTSGKKCVTQLQYDMMQQLVAPTLTSSLATFDQVFNNSMGNLTKTRTDNSSSIWWHLQLVQKYPTALDWLLTRCISQNLIAICVILASTVTSLYECWKLTLVALSVTLSIVVASTLLKKFGSSKYHLLYKKSQNEGDKLIEEIVHTRATIWMLGLQSYFIRSAQLSLQSPLRLAKRGIPYTAISYGLVEGIIYFTKATLFWYGTQLVRWREFDSHSVVVVWLLMIFMGSCHGKVMSTVSGWSQIKDQFATMKTGLTQGRSSQVHRSRNSALFVDGVVGGMTSSPKTIKSVCAAELFRVSLQFDNIKVLSDVSIRIPHGKWIGLMGKSGSGKTVTLQTLLYTHGRHQSGQILVDGQPMVNTMLSKKEQERHLVNWRQKFGMVDQDPRFFPISIHDNVALGSISFDPSKAQVQHACQLANIHYHIISLPDGYDTLLEKGGTSFSSGQQRLLALARALIREPKLLLLDDITSALDNTGIRLVHRTLKQLVENGTSILMVSHNSLMLESTDQVYELDQGRVVKQGRYGSL